MRAGVSNIDWKWYRSTSYFEVAEVWSQFVYVFWFIQCRSLTEQNMTGMFHFILIAYLLGILFTSPGRRDSHALCLLARLHGDRPLPVLCGCDCQHPQSCKLTLLLSTCSQSVEHETLNLRVVGSSPSLGTKYCPLVLSQTTPG